MARGLSKSQRYRRAYDQYITLVSQVRGAGGTALYGDGRVTGTFKGYGFTFYYRWSTASSGECMGLPVLHFDGQICQPTDFVIDELYRLASERDRYYDEDTREVFAEQSAG